MENAARARAQGFEGDGSWWATGWLAIRAALDFNDSKYLDFRFGPCSADAPDTDGDERCDVSGQPLERAPKWALALTPQVTLPVASIAGLGLPVPGFLSRAAMLGDVTVEYEDTQFLNPDFDPRKRQPSYFRLKGTIGLASDDGHWSLGVTVENPTNVATSVLIAQLPAANGLLVQVPEPDRFLYGYARWSF